MINDGIKTIIIVAIDSDNGIGKNNTLPWNIPVDKKFFRAVTTENFGTGAMNICVMGRKTWDSIPDAYRGLDKRITFVLSLTMNEETLNEQNKTKSEVYLIKSIAGIFDKVRALKEEVQDGQKRKIGSVFICGGASIYEMVAKRSFKIRIDEMYLTEIVKSYDCDVFLPRESFLFLSSLQNQNRNYFKTKDLTTGEMVYTSFTISYYSKNGSTKVPFNEEEKAYLVILKKLIHEGTSKMGRNGITYSKFVEHMSFNLAKSFPLYTTKKLNPFNIAEEMLFFLSGKTDTKLLEAKGIFLWKKNTSADFLKQMGLPWREGDMGPMYGFVWRHFGAEYKGCDENYDGKGFDQVEYCLNLLKRDPFSRRIIMTSFDAVNAPKGVLYPCHGIHIQFYVEEDHESEMKVIRLLSCSVSIRSNDWCVGHPYNVASYAFFVHFFCYALNNDVNYDGPKYKPAKLDFHICDVHLYDQHLENAMIQCTREPLLFPTLKIKDKVEGATNLFPSYDNLILENYKHYGFLKFEMIA